MTGNLSVFEKLNALPRAHYFWRNRWQFSQDVFWNNSRQGNDPDQFNSYLAARPKSLQKYINSVELGENKYIEAIKQQVLASDYICDEAVTTTLADDRFAKVFGAVSTRQISHILNEPCRTVRRELLKLRNLGLVFAIAAKGGNMLLWWPVGFLYDLKSNHSKGVEA